MARTLILNISEMGQTLPAIYGGFVVTVGHGRVVSDETTVAINELGGFTAMDGKWVVYPVSTDTAEGDFDVAANGVAMLATFIPGGGGGGGGPVSWASITGKPSFSDVATSGSYEDLTDTPAQFSGAYADLTGTPVIPAASNVAATDVGSSGSAGVLATFSRADHQHSHGTQAGGSLHASATTLSAGFMSASDKSKLDGLAAVATSGSYNDLSDKPSQFSGSYTDLTDKPSLFDGDYSSLTGAPALAPVATSGSYNDLSDLPAAGFSGSYTDLTNKPSLFSGAYADLSGKPSLFSGSYTDLTDKPEIPDLTTLAPVASSGAYADLSGTPSLASVATSGSYADLSNKPTAAYDIASFASGSLALAATTMKFYAPKNLTLTALNQGGGATVKVQVAGADITYPKSVTAGQLITTVVTAAGTDNYFTISAVEA